MNADERWDATRPPRRYPKGDRRRAEIVRAAFGAFANGGYRGSSMVQIAEACGVSRAGLLHHFPSKDLLLAAVLEERDRINGELFFAGMAPRTAGVDYFRRLIRVVEHNTAQREIVSLFATLSTEATDPDHPAHAYFSNRYRWLRADIADALTDLADRGLLRADVRADGLDADLIALIDGLQIQWLIDAQSVDVPARLRRRLGELLTPASQEHPVPWFDDCPELDNPRTPSP